MPKPISKKKLKQQLKNEILKPIIETQGRYLISKFGYAINTKRRTKLWGIPRLNGYLSICVYDVDEEKPTRLQIHRLVAKYFIANPYNYPVVMYDDDDKSNNHYKNLKWGTYQMNTLDMVRKGRHKNQWS